MTTEIEPYRESTWMQPQDLDQAMALSKVLATSSIVPYALRGKPADILIIMMYGMELGMGVHQAMRGINVIKGRPSLAAELRVAKTRERGHRVGVVCADCGEWADHAAHRWISSAQEAPSHQYRADRTRERCTVKVVRKDTGETAIVTWTIDDAIGARLLVPGKGADEGKLVSRSDKNEPLPWELYPQDMLYARAADRACKQIAPEVAFGLYTREEIEGMPDEPTRVSAEVGQPVTAADLIGSPPPAASPPPAGMEAPAEAGRCEPDPPGAVLSTEQAERIEDLWAEVGYPGDENTANRTAIMSKLIGRGMSVEVDLTAAEADAVISALEARAAKVQEPTK